MHGGGLADSGGRAATVAVEEATVDDDRKRQLKAAGRRTLVWTLWTWVGLLAGTLAGLWVILLLPFGQTVELAVGYAVMAAGAVAGWRRGRAAVVDDATDR